MTREALVAHWDFRSLAPLTERATDGRKQWGEVVGNRCRFVYLNGRFCRRSRVERIGPLCSDIKHGDDVRSVWLYVISNRVGLIGLACAEWQCGMDGIDFPVPPEHFVGDWALPVNPNSRRSER